jgi:hypothetical protein
MLSKSDPIQGWRKNGKFSEIVFFPLPVHDFNAAVEVSAGNGMLFRTSHMTDLF